jgi:hypothetical protein
LKRKFKNKRKKFVAEIFAKKLSFNIKNIIAALSGGISCLEGKNKTVSKKKAIQVTYLTFNIHH